jgi:hypothetical protein
LELTGFAALLACCGRAASGVFGLAVDVATHDGLAEILVAVGKISKPSTTAWLELVASTVMLPWLVVRV